MDWTAHVDAYCERLGPGLWAEPVNAATNLAFLIAAGVMAWRLWGGHLPTAWALTVILALIGIGSGLFHTLAQPWAGLADVLPIAGFALLYSYAASRAFLDLGRLLSGVIPRTARNLGLGTGLLILSLTFRGLDAPLCDQFAIGTHFLWHLLNAAMLGWMIETYRRHMLAPLPPQR